MEQEATYVGIDVAKSRVDVAIRPGGDVWRVDYDEPGIASLIAQLQTLNSAAVLLGATGGIEVPLVAAWRRHHCPLSWSTPARSGTLPRLLAGWPRRTLWMPASWPSLLRRSVRLCAHCGMLTPRISTSWPHDETSLLPCWSRRKTVSGGAPDQFTPG